MADKKAIEWFLKLYDSGAEITPEHIRKLVDGLRPRKRGRPIKSKSNAALLALFQLTTAAKVAELINLSSERTVFKRLNAAEDEGWTVIKTNSLVDKDNEPLQEDSWDFKGWSRQIWLDNTKETRCYRFCIENKQLKVETITI